MTTVFPGSLDTLSNPSSSDTLNSGTAALKHATQHSNANDCIEAIEAKLGTGVSTAAVSTVLRGTGTGTSAFGQVLNAEANFTWTTFTPTLQHGTTNLAHTVNFARHCIVGKMALVQFRITATASGAAGAAVQVTVPAALTSAQSGSLTTCGVAFVSAGSSFYHVIAQNASSTTIRFRSNLSTDYIGTNPSFTMQNGDTYSATLMYELA